MKQFFNQAQVEEESEINITPMLDVVFIMLIFFIVTATFVKEAGIDVNRPDAATAVKKENANILIAIGALLPGIGGTMTAPICAASYIRRQWPTCIGVSRGTITSLRCSFKITSAALTTRLSA